jgi:CBS domain-containing protein
MLEVDMQIREIMTTGVETITPDTTLRDAAGRMKSLDVGFLPVVHNERLLGTLTDRDIVIRAVAEGRDGNTTPARDVMTEEVFSSYDDDDVKEVAAYMREKEVRRLLILSRDKRLVGVVSIGDLSKVEGIQEIVGDTLKEITEVA